SNCAVSKLSSLMGSLQPSLKCGSKLNRRSQRDRYQLQIGISHGLAQLRNRAEPTAHPVDLSRKHTRNILGALVMVPAVDLAAFVGRSGALPRGTGDAGLRSYLRSPP